MLSLEEALGRVLGAIRPLASERVPLWQAAGRIAAEEVRATVDLPGFDNSAMDGYAVRAEDVAGATANAPARLRVIGEVAAGGFTSIEVTQGAALRIFTGSPLPSGADSVVMQEDTRRTDDTLEVLDGVKPLENVRLRGEDVKRHDVLLSQGDRLTAGLLGLMAAGGISDLAATRQPVVALLSTGDELCEPGAPLLPGKIYESNRTALLPLVASAGGVTRLYPIIRDTLDATSSALRDAFRDCDAVVTSGGVSVGEHDHVKSAFVALGGTLDFWRVAIRPGKPFVFGQWRDKFLFGLPGNPVSAFVTFLLLVRPALLKLQGANALQLLPTRAVLADRVFNQTDRRHFMRVEVAEAGTVRSAGQQASHLLKSLAQANGLLEVAPHSVMEAGTTVQVRLLP